MTYRVLLRCLKINLKGYIKMNNKCAILINSCDEYSDVWTYFFRLLYCNWPDLSYPIFLNTETKSFISPNHNINILNVLSSKKYNISWGERLIDCINRIDSEYILFFLEDFFLEESVKEEVIRDCLRWMDEDKEIAAFQLIPCGEYHNCQENKYNKESDKYQGFGLRKQYGYYKLSAGPCIWRKSELRKLTVNYDSPWEWEYFGSFRTWMYKGKFYSRIQKDESIFKYDIDHGGAVHRGKWVGSTVIPLLKRFDISFNPGDRIVEDDWMKDIQVNLPNGKRLSTAINNRIKKIKNIFMGFYIKL